MMQMRSHMCKVAFGLVLLLFVTGLCSPVSGAAVKVVGSSKSTVASGAFTADVTLSEKISPCSITKAGSLAVCLSGDDSVKEIASITLGLDKVTVTAAGTVEGKGPCFVVDACELWDKKACTEVDTVSVSATGAKDDTTLEAALLYSGITLDSWGDDSTTVKVNSASSVIVPTAVGTCSNGKYIAGEADSPTCVDDAATGTQGYIKNYQTEKLATFTDSDKDKDAEGAIDIPLECTSNVSVSSSSSSTTTTTTTTTTSKNGEESSSSTTSIPKKSTTSSGVTRVGSVSAMLAAATVTTVGVLAVSGN